MKKKFNYRLSRVRRIIENRFGIMANCFRIFHSSIKLQVHNIDKVVLACVLHNFLRRNCSQTCTSQDVFDVEDTSNATVTPDLQTASDNVLSIERGSNMNPNAEPKKVKEQFKIYFNNSGKVDWQHRMVSNN